MKDQGKQWKFIFGIFMVIFYMGMASILVFSNFFNISSLYRIIIGALLFIYGIFRGYRVWQQGS